MPSFFKSKNSSGNNSVPAEPVNWTAKMRTGLSRTRENLGKRISGLFGGGRIDEALYEELETILLTADAGVDATNWLLDELRRKVKRSNLTDAAQLKGALQEALITLLDPLAQPLDTDTHKPFVIMLAGVNGAGKTTTIGKLAHHFQREGKTVLLAAGDTFRAA
ncbi:MAG: signal recognition particle receptor subunit alpha, partial [Betaproteobacteria bacterium]|nr:signal recognition particle receptor subunit alpha [Betaproteobacteria bacterium]